MRILIRHACWLAVLMGVVVCCPVGAEAVEGADPVPGPASAAEFGGAPDAASYGAFFGDMVSRDDCDEFGRYERQWFAGGNRYRGNILAIQESCSISEFRIELTINSPATLYFYVHQLNAAGTAYEKIWEVEQYVSTDLGRRFYSSGEVLPDDDGLLLVEGEEYAFGAAWAPSAISYWRDNPDMDYPQPFSKGMILGAAMVNSAPPIDSLFPSSAVPWEHAAASMDVCYQPLPGACCVSGEPCQEIQSGECLALSGSFTAPGVTCAEIVDCDLLVDQACCFAEETCALLNEFACEYYGGVPLGLDFCENPNPCEPTGACCIDGICYQVTETECLDLGGLYRGDDALCGELQVPCNAGACCYSDSLCIPLLSEQCSGVFLGLGTTCDDAPCGDTGACCFESSPCVEGTRYDCVLDGGSFVKDGNCGTACDECADDPDCDDGLYCNGAEVCIDHICHASEYPCGDPLPYCDEEADSCVECLYYYHCDDESPCTTDDCNVDNECEHTDLDDLTPCPDGLFCNGEEVCMSGVCEEGTPPCESGESCDEDNDVCTECLVDEDCDDGDLCTTDVCVDGACVFTPVDCDDGLFCNGVEECDSETGDCVDGVAPCDPQYCDEDEDVCRNGDMDADGDVDLEDFALWQVCFERLPVVPECLAGDFDENGAVDLDDFAEFVLTGP